MASRPHYSKFFWKEWDAKTQDLDPYEFTAYMRLLTWAKIASPDFCSIPDDDVRLARITRLGLRMWGRVRERVLGFWEKDETPGGGVIFRHQRLLEEASSWQQLIAAQQKRRSGEKPQTSLQGGYSEFRSQIESKKTYTSSVVPSAKGTPVVELPTNRSGDIFPIYQEVIKELRGCYPAVDVEQGLRSMRAWLLANPSNRKTSRGMMKFVNGWLSREQNRAPRVVSEEPADDRAASLKAIRAYREKLEAENGAQ